MADVIEPELALIKADLNTIDIILGDTPPSPTQVQIRHTVKKSHPAYKYYLKIRSSLTDWYDEFCEEIQNGTYKYDTLRSFAISKTKNKEEREYIRELCGRKPEVDIEMRVPWLGDWERRRASSAWLPAEPAKLHALQQSIKAKLTSWEIIRSANPIMVQQFAKWMRSEEQIEHAFAGRIFLPNMPPTSPENVSRWELYKSMHRICSTEVLRMVDELMRVNGQNPESPVQVVQINQTNNDGRVDQNSIDQKTLETFKLAKALEFNEETYKMPLPESLKKTVDKPLEVTKGKPVQ